MIDISERVAELFNGRVGTCWWRLQYKWVFFSYLYPEMQANEIQYSLWISATKCHFHVTSYLTELCASWRLFRKEDTLWCLSWTAYISLTCLSGYICFVHEGSGVDGSFVRINLLGWLLNNGKGFFKMGKPTKWDIAYHL